MVMCVDGGRGCYGGGFSSFSGELREEGFEEEDMRGVA